MVSTPLKNMSQLGLLSPIYGKIKIFQTTNQIINHEYTPPPQLSSSSNSICISKSWMIQENPLDEQPNRSKGLNYSGLYVRRWGSPIFCVWTNGLYIYIYWFIYIYIHICMCACPYILGVHILEPLFPTNPKRTSRKKQTHNYTHIRIPAYALNRIQRLV